MIVQIVLVLQFYIGQCFRMLQSCTCAGAEAEPAAVQNTEECSFDWFIVHHIIPVSLTPKCQHTSHYHSTVKMMRRALQH